MTILSFAALFAGPWIDPCNVLGAASLAVGVFLRSSAWRVCLTVVVSAFRSRITKVWLGRINVVSGIVIGIFAPLDQERDPRLKVSPWRAPGTASTAVRPAPPAER